MSDGKLPVECFCGEDSIVVLVEKDVITKQFMVRGLRKAIAPSWDAADLHKIKIYKRGSKEAAKDPLTTSIVAAGESYGSCDYEIVSGSAPNTVGVRASCREPSKSWEKLVASMTVQLTGDQSGSVASGCVINGEGYVLTTRHQLYQHHTIDRSGLEVAAEDFIAETYTARMLDDQGYVSKRQYTCDADDVYDREDLVVLRPTEKLVNRAHFTLRKMGHHNDNVFTGGRPNEFATFFLDDGILNYDTPTCAMVTAHADRGWNGGPVFHFHDDSLAPTLVGVVQGECTYGGSIATQIQLLPDNLLTEPRGVTHAWCKLRCFAQAAGNHALSGDVFIATAPSPPMLFRPPVESTASSASTTGTLPPPDKTMMLQDGSDEDEDTVQKNNPA